MQLIKIIVSVPKEHADALRLAIAEAGAGELGNYTHCSFSMSGTGRFLPNNESTPAYGDVGEVASVEEEQIHTFCAPEKLDDVVKAIKQAHPYEEVVLETFLVDMR